jgi:hypothetical protein
MTTSDLPPTTPSHALVIHCTDGACGIRDIPVGHVSPLRNLGTLDALLFAPSLHFPALYLWVEVAAPHILSGCAGQLAIRFDPVPSPGLFAVTLTAPKDECELAPPSPEPHP